MTSNHLLPVSAVLFSFLTCAASAAITYNTPGAVYSQNFNAPSGLATTGSAITWTDDATIPGWYASYGGSASPNYYTSNGTAAYAGRVLSLGAADSSDRALGSQSDDTASNQHRIAAQFVNSSTVTMTQFSLTYTGEIWRAITLEAADGFTFEYRIGTGPTWTAAPALNFTSPYVAPGASSSRDGNAAANRTLVSGTVTGIEWQAGQELWLRWTDNGTGGDLQGQIGLDDVSFFAVPEPSAACLGLAGALVLAARRRR